MVRVFDADRNLMMESQASWRLIQAHQPTFIGGIYMVFETPWVEDEYWIGITGGRTHVHIPEGRYLEVDQ